MTDLNLTDLETCYKAIKTDLLKSIPIRSNDFRFEVEITFKLAKRRARVFEAPIRYLPRTREEGKYLKTRAGLLAFGAMLRFWAIDDLYANDDYGSIILSGLKQARRLNFWVGKTLRPFVGDRVLELGAGLGILTNQLIPRETYLAADSNPNHIRSLQSYAFGKPYLHVLNIDPCDPEHFDGLRGRFDTAVVVNLLERVSDANALLSNLWMALEPGGRIIVMAPQAPTLYGTLDRTLGRNCRYTAADLVHTLQAAGFRLQTTLNFNRVSVPGWWLNGKLLRRQRISRIQLKMLDVFLPLLTRIDRILPWKGLSLIAVAVKD